MKTAWKKGLPTPNRPVMIRSSDFMGEFTLIAEWVPYSLKGPKRQHGKGRWMKRTPFGRDRLTRKEAPEAWRELTEEEISKYGDLSNEN